MTNTEFKFETPQKVGLLETTKQGTAKVGRKHLEPNQKKNFPLLTRVTPSEWEQFVKALDWRDISIILREFVYMYISLPNIHILKQLIALYKENPDILKTKK